jgi:hypothetical protein
VCNYELDICKLETDKDFKAVFKGLFRRADDYEDQGGPGKLKRSP